MLDAPRTAATRTMTPLTAALMADYNRWMNERLYEAAARVPEAELARDRGAFFGSILQTLNHVVVADCIWLHRFARQPDAAELRLALAGIPLPTSLRQEMAGSLAALRDRRRELDELIQRWAGALTAEQLEAPLTYQNMAGRSFRRNFGHLVLHFFNHQTHHRGQASTLLFQAGVDIGVTDLLAVIPEA